MRPAWILALAASGCRGILGIGEAVAVIDDGRVEQDAPADVVIDAPPTACVEWHPPGLLACDYPAGPALALAGGAFTYDTSTAGGTLSGPAGTLRSSTFVATLGDGPEVAVLSLDALSIAPDATLTVIGAKPLLVLAGSAIIVDGVLDASSRRAIGQLGAGANEGCTTTSGAPGGDAPAAGGSGGGGGGGFQGTGGRAGDGGNTPDSGGAGGSAIAAALRGGCPGGASGAAGGGAQPPSTEFSQAAGGAGGGAIRLIARDRIAVASGATIAANGAGGAGAPLRSACGGGGGGGGGYLGFDAPIVTLDGAVSATGGAGGGAGGPTDAGNDGQDGVALGALGGARSVTCGEPGGDGSAPTHLDGNPGTSYATGCAAGGRAGGGGGGGASGFIVVASPAFTAADPAKIVPPVLQP